MYISSACDVVIEITRRCNMCCAHCLRGDAEAVDIQERYIDAFLDSFADVVVGCDWSYESQRKYRIGNVMDEKWLENIRSSKLCIEENS